MCSGYIHDHMISDQGESRRKTINRQRSRAAGQGQ